jgi:hypothetical protein
MDQPGTIFCLVPDNKYATEIVGNPANRDRRCVDPGRGLVITDAECQGIGVELGRPIVYSRHIGSTIHVIPQTAIWAVRSTEF